MRRPRLLPSTPHRAPSPSPPSPRSSHKPGHRSNPVLITIGRFRWRRPRQHGGLRGTVRWQAGARGAASVVSAAGGEHRAGRPGPAPPGTSAVALVRSPSPPPGGKLASVMTDPGGMSRSAYASPPARHVRALVRLWRVPTAANGSASAALGDATTRPLPEKLVHNQIVNATPRGRAGSRGGGTAEGRGRPGSKPRGKVFSRVTDDVQTDQNQIGNAILQGRDGTRDAHAKGRGKPPSKPRGKGFRVQAIVQTVSL